MNRLARHLRSALAALALTAAGVAHAASPPSAGHWAAAWAAAPQAAPATGPLAQIEDRTLRQTVRLTLGGRRLQVRFSNEYGRTPTRIGAASVAFGNEIRPLTFGGRASATILPGAPLLSDPVDLVVPRMAEVAISLYFPDRTRIETVHALGLHPTLVSEPGDFTGRTTLPIASEIGERALLAGVAVWTQEPTRVVAAMGASLVDGFRSTPGAYANWPDVLARRLAARRGPATGVINLGISSNKLISHGTGLSALARLDQDILSQPGVTHLILIEGRNDLAAFPVGAEAEALYAGYVQIAERLRQRGIKAIAATITPDATANWDARREAERKKLNGLIRASRAFDAVIDFDAVLQNPAALGIKPEYDSGDHLHPNDLGYRTMAESIDLGLLDR